MAFYDNWKIFDIDKWEPKTVFRKGFLLVAGISIVYSFVILMWFKPDGSGTFGDSFGVVTSIFNGIALVALIATLIQQQKTLEMQSEQLDMQKEELGLQREEMVKTREEFGNQTVQFELQNQKLEEQKFEDKFFKMLEMFVGLKNKQIEQKLNPSIYSNFIFKGTIGDFVSSKMIKDWDNDVISESVASSMPFFKTTMNDGTFKSFFLNLYQVVKFVDDFFGSPNYGTDEYKKAKQYTNIIRANLTENETIALMVNCVYVGFDLDCYSFKDIVEKYSFFEHIDAKRLLNIKSTPSLDILITSVAHKYEAWAFGDNTELHDWLVTMKRIAKDHNLT